MIGGRVGLDLGCSVFFFLFHFKGEIESGSAGVDWTWELDRPGPALWVDRNTADQCG